MTVVHLKRDAYDVRIDRQTAWGNPFVLGHDGDRDEVIAKYLQWVTTSSDPTATWIRDNVHKLHGKILGCWCAPHSCHGDVLLVLAEQAVYDLDPKTKDLT